jgi:hypothetical protein
MALFLSAKVKEKPAPAEQTEIENLRAELQRTKDAARLRAAYGPKLTDARVDELLAEEADMVIRKAKAKETEELNRQNEIKLDKAYRDLACELVRDGKMLIAVDGTRLTEITPDLLIPCPYCGKPLGDISIRIYVFAKAWYWTSEESGDRNRITTFTIFSARSPLTDMGFAGYIQPNCPSCKAHHHDGRGIAVVQMVLI